MVARPGASPGATFTAVSRLINTPTPTGAAGGPTAAGWRPGPGPWPWPCPRKPGSHLWGKTSGREAGAQGLEALRKAGSAPRAIRGAEGGSPVPTGHTVTGPGLWEHQSPGWPCLPRPLGPLVLGPGPSRLHWGPPPRPYLHPTHLEPAQPPPESREPRDRGRLALGSLCGSVPSKAVAAWERKRPESELLLKKKN